jgi:hypothetical protein
MQDNENQKYGILHGCKYGIHLSFPASRATGSSLSTKGNGMQILCDVGKISSLEIHLFCA